MQQYSYTASLKEDPKLIEQYKQYHETVWPEVKEALKRIGIVEMKIFIYGSVLFMNIGTEDYFDPKESFLKYLALSPKIAAWEELMDTFKEEGEKGKWVLMNQIFEL